MGFFTSDQILKVTTMSRLAKYVITQVHACREEKVMVTSSDREKQTRTLLDFNFVKKRKVNKEQDEND